MALATENPMIATIAMPLKIHLIRHGETDWSLSGQYTSRTDLALTEQGARQARELGQRLGGICFTRIFTSPRKRAQQTYALSGLTPASEIDLDLAEWDYGDYEGRSTPEIRLDRPDWFLWRDGVPNGETVEQVAARTRIVIHRAMRSQRKVAMFAHGHVLRILAATWLGLEPRDGKLFTLGTAAISVLGFERDTRVIVRWNS